MSNLPTLTFTEWNALCAAAAGALRKFPKGYANDPGGPFYEPIVITKLKDRRYLTHNGFSRKAVFKITSAGEDYIATRHCGVAEVANG